MYPANPLLHDSVSFQERAQHHALSHMNYAAAGGINKEYTRLGGTMVNSKKDVDPKLQAMADKVNEFRDAKKKSSAPSGIVLL